MKGVIAFGVGVVLAAPTASASISDLMTWTQVEDPADPNLSGVVDSSSQATLSASGAVANARDIGYQSVDGQTAAGSSAGFAFDPSGDFALAIDFSLSFLTPTNVGGLGIGFGIGEDADGMNGAGAGLFTMNGMPFSFGGAARINDVTQTPLAISATPSLSASLHVSYDASTGSVTAGVGGVGASAPSATATYSGIQNQWGGALLFPSFFLRSDNSLGAAWSGGDADAVFSNFRVISGAPVQIPAPGSIAALGLAGVMLIRRRRPGA